MGAAACAVAALAVGGAEAQAAPAGGGPASPSLAERAGDGPLTVPVVRDGIQYRVVIEPLMATDDPAAEAAARDAYRQRFAADTLAGAATEYAFQGYVWTTKGAAWEYNPAGKPPDLTGERDLLAAAAQTWSTAGSGFHFRDAGTGNGGTGACHGSADGRNTISWAAQPGSVLAVTCAWYAGGVASEFDMEIDPQWAWTTGAESPSVDFQSVVLHELGHALGLAHSEDRAAVMYASYKWGTVLHELSPDDLAALTALYGSAAQPLAAPLAAVPLSSGANLLTWPGPAMAPAKALASVLSVVQDVYAADAESGTWRRYSPTAPAYVSNLDMLRPGVPYWIMTSGLGTLMINP